MDEEIYDVGFNPQKVYNIEVTFVEKLNGKVLDKWNEEVVLAVIEVSAKHALDLGHYNGEEWAFVLTT